jgi:hypothetical protein
MTKLRPIETLFTRSSRRSRPWIEILGSTCRWVLFMGSGVVDGGVWVLCGWCHRNLLFGVNGILDRWVNRFLWWTLKFLWRTL